MKFKQNNTRMILQSLGEVELKYISFRDTQYFAELLQKEISYIDFVREVLFHQIVRPKFEFSQFQRLANEDLEKLARIFVEKEQYSFKYFQDTGSFFKDFKNALEIHDRKRIEEFRKTMEPAIRSAQHTFAEFGKNYAQIIKSPFNGASYIRESLDGLSAIAEHVMDVQQQWVQSYKPVIEQYQSMANIIKNSLEPQIEFWQKWAAQNIKVFDKFSNYWLKFQQQYNIAEQTAVRVLRRYKWFVTPSMPISFVFEVVKIAKKRGRRDKEVNMLFVQFFRDENWGNLKEMADSWGNSPLLKKRYKILSDCIETIKIADKKEINGANIVLPTLITQIDGALTDYLYSKGILWDCEYDDWIDRGTGKVKKIGRKSQFRKIKPKILTTPLDDLANDIFLNILFQKSQQGKSLETPFNFNRHKIIHGENIKYGRKDYLIRAFLILDFLAHVI